MKLLIIGGTRFLGRHLVTSALARNHEVSLFNRGTEPLAGVETIVGDRHTEIHKLTGRRWDAVITPAAIYRVQFEQQQKCCLIQSIDTFFFPVQARKSEQRSVCLGE